MKLNRPVFGRCIRNCLTFAAILIAAQVGAQNPAPTAQVSPGLDQALKNYLSQLPALSAQRIEVDYIDPRIQQAPVCPNGYDFYLPSGNRPWGRLSIGIRCQRSTVAAQNFLIKVAAYGDYLAAARFLPAGTRLTDRDVGFAQGDLARLPADVIFQANEALGRQINRPLQPGAPIALNNLRQPAVIKAGERVRVSVVGPGFEATGEGVAVTGGAVGDTIRIRMSDNQQQSGQITKPGAVEIRLE